MTRLFKVEIEKMPDNQFLFIVRDVYTGDSTSFGAEDKATGWKMAGDWAGADD